MMQPVHSFNHVDDHHALVDHDSCSIINIYSTLFNPLKAHFPQCPSTMKGLQKWVTHPSIALISIGVALSSFVYVIVISRCYNSIGNLDKTKIRSRIISNTTWIWYYASICILAIARVIQYSTLGHYTPLNDIEGVFYIFKTIVLLIASSMDCLAILFLSLSLLYQIRYRSSSREVESSLHLYRKAPNAIATSLSPSLPSHLIPTDRPPTKSNSRHSHAIQTARASMHR